MQEYQSKVNYLRHIKNIADIQDGLRKPTPLSTIFNQTHTSIIHCIQNSVNKDFCLPNIRKEDAQEKLRRIRAHKEL